MATRQSRRGFLGQSIAGVAKTGAIASGIANETIANEKNGQLTDKQRQALKDAFCRRIEEEFDNIVEGNDEEISIYGNIHDYFFEAITENEFYENRRPNRSQTDLQEIREQATKAQQKLWNVLREYREVSEGSELTWEEVIGKEHWLYNDIIKNAKHSRSGVIREDDIPALFQGIVACDIEDPKYDEIARVRDKIDAKASRLIKQLVERSGIEADTATFYVNDALDGQMAKIEQVEDDLPELLQALQEVDGIITADAQRLINAYIGERQARDAAAILKEEEWKKRRHARKIEEAKEVLGSNVDWLGSCAFVKLSHNKEKAEEKLKMINDFLAYKYPYNEERKKAGDIAHDIIVEPITKHTFPEGRYVPVPTDRYRPVYGVQLNIDQLEAICSFLEANPRMARAVELIDFVHQPQIGI